MVNACVYVYPRKTKIYFENWLRRFFLVEEGRKKGDIQGKGANVGRERMETLQVQNWCKPYELIVSQNLH